MSYIVGVKLDELIATQYKIIELLQKMYDEETKEAQKPEPKKERE